MNNTLKCYKNKEMNIRTSLTGETNRDIINTMNDEDNSDGNVSVSRFY